MSAPRIYTPVILPPAEGVDAELYYDALATADVTVTIDDAPEPQAMTITVTGPDTVHPDVSDGLPVSMTYAVTGGFVSYYRRSATLPTPEAQPLTVPANLVTTAVGSLVINVWMADYASLEKLPPSQRPNRILIAMVDEASVKLEFERHIKKKTRDELIAHWKTVNATVPPPSDDAMRAVYLTSFINGQAEVDVLAGVPLGKAAMVAVQNPLAPAPVNVGQIQARAWNASADATPVLSPVPFEDVLDNVVLAAESAFEKHPLIVAANALIDVHFKSQFTIWDRDPGVRAFVPFSSASVTLVTQSQGNLGPIPTDATGSIDYKAKDLQRRERIQFRYKASAKSHGEDISTVPHQARMYVVQGENTGTYRAKWFFHTGYANYIKELKASEDKGEEKYGGDRGNAGDQLQIQSTRISHITSAETWHLENAPGPSFNVLFEGDSWFSYPPADRGEGDAYGHLDELIRAGLKPEFAYNRFPVQHHGDRSDQMFDVANQTSGRQWHHTEKLLDEYRIDLIVCSAGGNDFAEPGVSNASASEEADLKPHRIPGLGCLDMAKASQALPAKSDGLKRLAKLSFATLLPTHPWYSFVTDPPPKTNWPTTQGWLLDRMKQFPSVSVDPDAKDIALDPNDPKESDLERIGKAVVKLFPVRTTVADRAPYDDFLNHVFDPDRYAERFNTTLANWRVLMKRATDSAIPVVTHTYCYPLFNENPTSPFGQGVIALVGPWFHPRLNEAGIKDRRIQKICIKAMIDDNVERVLAPLKTDYSLRFAEVRAENQRKDRWRDEMHLKTAGFRVVAEKIFEQIKTHPKLKAYFKD